DRRKDGELTTGDEPGSSFIIYPSSLSISAWAVLIFALVYPTVSAWVYFRGLAGNGEGPNSVMRVTYGLGKALQFALPVLSVVAFERRWLRLPAPNFRGLPLALGFGLFVAAGVIGLYHGVPRDWLMPEATARMVRSKVEEFGLATPGKFILLAVL